MEEKNKKSCFVITPIGDINSSVRPASYSQYLKDKK